MIIEGKRRGDFLIGSLFRKSRVLIGIFLKKVLDRILPIFGYKIISLGNHFIDAKTTILAARNKGLPINEYIESVTNNPLKKGRRNRVIEHMKKAGIFNVLSSVCEIGPGTGRYLEKIIECGKPKYYEVYETNIGWRDYLKSEYSESNGCKILAHAADGKTIAYTKDLSCDLVHAHAVFVYLPLFQSLNYIKETFRVCKKGGYVVFDFIPAESFSYDIAEAWLRGSHVWPVLLPQNYLLEMAEKKGFVLVDTFEEVYGESFVKYLILKRN